MAWNNFIIMKEAATYKCQSSINEALSTLSTEGEIEREKRKTCLWKKKKKQRAGDSVCVTSQLCSQSAVDSLTPASTSSVKAIYQSSLLRDKLERMAQLLRAHAVRVCASVCVS